MRIAGIIPASLVNGEGIRFVVFLQGCYHECPGCQNPETWDYRGGYEKSPVSIAEHYMLHAHLLDGITLSGGDPFYQEQYCMDLLSLLPADTNVWVYTGYTYEEIKDRPLAKRADVIVDGPYIDALRTETLPYRGSTNQRIIRRNPSMKIVEVDPDFREAVEANDGYCPCMTDRTPDTKCMCREFREQKEPGPCHCGRFEKVVAKC